MGEGIENHPYFSRIERKEGGILAFLPCKRGGK